ncbi:roadblock/LC7 domain-containing protein [Saccharopolyspora hordei]|uniref:Putative regulator of Ras-like GTPase activity (Roadblock/LC7/MglB family) n=1 Tax=Saccharopolyspora hordei TaxID=1838 RepID=A0A853AK37_9PSEU|nr:roadblock/LC7 domain-containing protein [Saccharopolyspora hordei]NYI84146.1 putative regulator of Ras-like GTPase activity (Roadblock/LC7/MglB family) [Saccharopolyspora hordei]
MTETASKLSWLLDDFVQGVHGADHAVVLSNDGLVIAKSADMERDSADKLAAAASSLRSIGKGVSKDFDRGQVAQTHVEMERGFLFVSAAGSGACLAVLCGPDADIELVAYEMGRLITRVGSFLSAAPRETHGAVAERA